MMPSLRLSLARSRSAADLILIRTSGCASISRSQPPIVLKVASKTSAPLPRAPTVRFTAVSPEDRISVIWAAVSEPSPPPGPPRASMRVALSYPSQGEGAVAAVTTRGTAVWAAARVERKMNLRRSRLPDIPSLPEGPILTPESLPFRGEDVDHGTEILHPSSSSGTVAHAGPPSFALPSIWDLQDRIRTGEGPLDQPPADAAQGHLRSPRPAGVGLARRGPRIDVDEPAGGGTLREGTEEIRLAVLADVDAQGEVEGEVLVRSLDWGNETAPPALQAKRHSRRRRDDGDAQRELPVFAHRLAPVKPSVSRTSR